MGFVDTVSRFMGLTLLDRPPERTLSTVEDEVRDIIAHRTTGPIGAWKVPTVRQAMGVPSIYRAVSLISSTTGMLSVQGFRNGEVMADPPRLIVRPDPGEAPGTFYAGTAAQKAKYGEFVWWIAKRDDDGLAAALILVPLHELRVEQNTENRLRPKYQWGTVTSTRWSPANPEGQFVHVKNSTGEPFALRGEGPLQLAQAAVSIAVESETWAANFYGKGGYPRDVIKHAGMLDPTLRDDFDNPDPENGISEPDRLKAQYQARDNNTPLVIDQAIESITHPSIDQAGAQMLDARVHETGDHARMFGIPGSLLEFQQPGSSLTYQNLEGEFTKFVRTCLQPEYLEPMEQTLSDLLTRTTTARFNVDGFLRADIRTRYDVHAIAIDKGIYDPAYARVKEGIAAGDVEFAPVPFAAPAAVPTSVPRNLADNVRCPSCSKLVARRLGSGSEMQCPRCKAEVRVA